MNRRRLAAQLLLGLFLVGAFRTVAVCGEPEDALKVAQELRAAVTNNNPDGVIKYVRTSVCMGDECLSANEFRKLLNDKDSWLYKMLFSDAKSWRSYLACVTRPGVYQHKVKEFYCSSFVDKGCGESFATYLCVSKRNGVWRLKYLDPYYEN